MCYYMYVVKLNTIAVSIKNHMIKSSEFIKGYTEIIVCALLSGGDDYIYSLVKRITEYGGGEIQITNPSMLMIMKKLLAEGKITAYTARSKSGADRRYYSLTQKGREYYAENFGGYINSLLTLKGLISGG